MMADGDQRSKQLAEVLRLHLTEGKGIKAIARQLQMHRRTVRRLLGVARGVPRQKAGRARTSILDPYQEEIRQALADCAEIRAPAVLDRLRAKGYQGGISVVRDRLRQLRPRPKQEAFFTREYGPGQMLQVDWADFGFALPGCARRVSAFVAALAFSRYLYLEYVLSQSMGSFLRCMDRALRALRPRRQELPPNPSLLTPHPVTYRSGDNYRPLPSPPPSTRGEPRSRSRHETCGSAQRSLHALSVRAKNRVETNDGGQGTR